MRHRGWHLFSLVDMMLWFRHVPLLDAANLGEWRESQSSAEGWGMHELGKFIDGLMAEMGMDRAELGRRSGLSRQHIHNLLTKETLGRMPDDATIAGLAKAFPAVGEGPFLTKAAMAIGVPVDRLTVVEPDFSKLTNEQLMGILRARLEQGGQQWDTGTPGSEDDDGGPGLYAVPPAARGKGAAQRAREQQEGE